MEGLKNGLLAPFSTEAAASATPAQIAVVYGIIGLLVGTIILK